MTYIPGLREQTVLFFKSMGFGFILGIVYDVFRTVKVIFIKDTGNKKSVYIRDLIYCIFCTFSVFVYNLVVNNGEFRLYVLFGSLLGFIVYYFSLGALAIKITDALSACTDKIKLLLKNTVFKPIFFVISKFSIKTKKNYQKVIKKSKKLKNNSKFRLQKHSIMLYNAKCYSKKLRRTDKNNVKDGKNNKKNQKA